ncbi:MAG TPA: HD domain-containing phosphohydrolase [Thermoleophilaceae bacterium]|jgi:HD-GYP domain-containing protein (c-di-GMP phosphodiesterase class II)
MVLARDVLTGVHGQLPLVRAGVVLDDHARDGLVAAGINAVYVEDELSAGIEVQHLLSPETRNVAMGAVVRTFADASARFVDGGKVSRSVAIELTGAVQLVVDDLANADHAVVALADLASADSYTLQHSIDATALGLLIARRHFRDHGRPAPSGRRSFEKIDTQLLKLGIGMLLQDVGKLALPAAILKKAGALTEEELALVRTHPLCGIELVRGDVIGPLAKGVIRSHHERWDGYGYPEGIVAREIPEFARIAAIADAFDAMTSMRVYSRAAAQHEGVRMIVEGSGSSYDPAIVESFRKVVAPYPAGSEIALADGRRGIVVSVPAGQLELPLVRVHWDERGERIDPEEIDLREQPLLAPTLPPASQAA